MTSSYLSLLAIISVSVLSAISVDAFVIPQPAMVGQGVVVSHPLSLSRMNAVSMDGKGDEQGKSGASNSSSDDEISWEEALDSKLLKEVREELILKYLEQGTSQEVAEKEVEEFLADRERSEKYLEMRAYALAQADDLGVGTVLQLVAGFLVGFLAIAGPKYFDAMQ